MLIFQPKNNCVVIANSGTDVYGMPKPGVRKSERCSIVKFIVRNEKSSVRADSSASRGNAMELEADGIFLMAITTSADIDDLIEINQHRMRVMGKHARHNAAGALHHYEIHCTYWSDKETSDESAATA